MWLFIVWFCCFSSFSTSRSVTLYTRSIQLLLVSSFFIYCVEIHFIRIIHFLFLTCWRNFIDKKCWSNSGDIRQRNIYKTNSKWDRWGEKDGKKQKKNRKNEALKHQKRKTTTSILLQFIHNFTKYVWCYIFCLLCSMMKWRNKKTKKCKYSSKLGRNLEFEAHILKCVSMMFLWL